MVDLSTEALASDNAVMREFRASQAFDVWNKYLIAMSDDVNRRLINGTGDALDMLRYWQGTLAGLKMAQQVPEHVEALAKQSTKK